MTPIERVYAAGIVVLLLFCSILFLDFRQAQQQRNFFREQMQVAIWANWKRVCPTNSVVYVDASPTRDQRFIYGEGMTKTNINGIDIWYNPNLVHPNQLPK